MIGTFPEHLCTTTVTTLLLAENTTKEILQNLIQLHRLRNFFLLTIYFYWAFRDLRSFFLT